MISRLLIRGRSVNIRNATSKDSPKFVNIVEAATFGSIKDYIITSTKGNNDKYKKTMQSWLENPQSYFHLGEKERSQSIVAYDNLNNCVGGLIYRLEHPNNKIVSFFQNDLPESRKAAMICKAESLRILDDEEMTNTMFIPVVSSTLPGVGTNLLRAAEKIARKEGRKNLALCCISSNARALKCYGTFGMIPENTQTVPNSEDNWLFMNKKIENRDVIQVI